jgi:TM2 domain-containing membrane protein YozV
MRKDPTLAGLLNLLLLGTGHIYLGRTAKGLLILAVGVALGMIVWPATVLVAVWAMYDAYKTAQKMNRATAAEKRVVEKTT